MEQPYAARREEIYGALRQEGVFTWDHMYGEEYALASVHRITAEFRQEIAEATEKLGEIFRKAVLVIQHGDPQLLSELGLPQEAVEAVRVSLPLDFTTAIGRFDFAPTPDGLKMLEFNSDTPTGIVETFHVNGRVCDHYGLTDPNAGLSAQIAEAFQQTVIAYKRQGYPVDRLYFTSLDWHEEDAGTTRYLLEQSQLPGKFVALSDLRYVEEEDALYALAQDELHLVEVLYRLHALEKLAEERDADGYPTGAEVLDLIARGRLAIINPPAGFIAQTKALQALIWNLHETNQFFSAEEQEVIGRYMLPTYLENRFQGSESYVSKPIFGREGGGVTLHAASGAAIDRDQEDFYWEQDMIYQRLVEMETVEIETLKGPYHGHLLWGSFLIGGQASGIIARVGGRITGNLSYYLPVGIE
ncbi:MAG TPA: glutathionylspermidine synthase family protein [Bacilli bacterium]|nr:glutathionylspermidine synthase family protein [Bacilli bacterium]